MEQFIRLLALIAIGVIVLKVYTGKMAHNTAPAAQAPAGPTEPLKLTPAEAKERLDSEDDIILLDVRTQEEFDGGHIPGAVCLPNEEISAEMPVSFGWDSKLFVYCRSGRRSADAAKKLADMGYTQVFDLGGILDWPYETTTE